MMKRVALNVNNHRRDLNVLNMHSRVFFLNLFYPPVLPLSAQKRALLRIKFRFFSQSASSVPSTVNLHLHHPGLQKKSRALLFLTELPRACRVRGVYRSDSGAGTLVAASTLWGVACAPPSKTQQ